ncbi:hypothetical protein MIC97_16555 [Aquamicrobium sp. NLF2-7]|uniref:hypothetical protein n=1 Tax=Aquamicrobium sp. NLF2-7 TaxID=2918753 RepID=UPI001EFBE89F|nr:hypothetical protein [Aquamicrobium sp. NLF2-7]MCG8273111.1 hypothetical protein [Aquamicrobium sp. NLF2-7]
MTLFESPKFLVNQTGENLAELDRIIRDLFARYGGRRIVEVDPKTGDKIFKIVFGGELPTNTRHIVASAINDLRHALDQATCAAIEAITGNEPGLIYFPIAANPNDLEGRVGKFPPEIRDAFLGFQSYPTGEWYTGGNDLICDLSKAAQRKHRICCKIGGQVTRISGAGRADGGHISTRNGATAYLPPRWDITKNEMILGISGPEGHLNYDVDITFYVALYDAGPLTGAPAIASLSQLRTVVSDIVLSLEAETEHILCARS